jgi:hypothetical protein
VRAAAAPSPPAAVPDNLQEPWEEDEESREDPEAAGTAAFLSLPYAGPLPGETEPMGMDGLGGSESEKENGELLAQLEQLSTLMRPARSAAPTGSSPGFLRYCIGCERSLSGEEEPVTCSSCHGALCPDCGRAAQLSESSGRCPTCAALEVAGPTGPASGGDPTTW